ncbi:MULTISPECIES: hypothetical protein [Photorhabdus]|nr:MULTISPECIES: hypothetical protein [Photorhabdus]
MTGVSECSQQRGNLKDDGYKLKSGFSLISAQLAQLVNICIKIR